MINSKRQVCFIIVLLGVLLAGVIEIASAQAPKPEVRHREIRFEFIKGQLGDGFVSQQIRVPIEAAEPFLAVGVVWTVDGGEADHIRITLRGSPDGDVWGQWRAVNLDDDSERIAGEFTGALSLFDRNTRFIQYRVEPEPGRRITLTRLRLIFISPDATPHSMQGAIEQKLHQAMSQENQQPSIKYPKPIVVTRTEWGCPDGQITMHGTLSYTTVTHLIVHHTATGNTAANNDWAAVVRTIWNLHVFTNGWADIGYNYLIDPNGVIYEGRAGGDNVLGAHFSGVNAGTMGVSMIGTFTDLTPSSKALISLRKILAWKADQRNIDPTETSLHAASKLQLNHISGHRDGPAATECPGNALYPLLPGLRTDVRTLIAEKGVVASVSAASFKQSALAPESIVAAFGTGMTSLTMAASGSQLPTSLNGTSVMVRDSADVEKPAPLFFVSPEQVNFLMPAGLASGEAAVIVANREGLISTGNAMIAPIGPALFAANANGRGVAAAVVLRIKESGAQSYEPVAVFDQAQNKFVATPIDLAAARDQVFLLAYGTGIRGRSALAGVSAKIGGVESQVLFAGEAAGFFGLDQLNLRLLPSLVGRGEVDLEIAVEGRAANVLKLLIR